jgi:hypothetical protein
MQTKFEELLKNLGDELAISLKPDDLNACTLKIDDSFLVQLKIDKTQTYLFICSFITELPPGKFRENVFTKTLIANNKIPRVGSFAFNDHDSNLVLFEYLPLETLNTQNLKNTLAQFTEKGITWKEAIESGLAAPLEFLRELEHKIKPTINLKS